MRVKTWTWILEPSTWNLPTLESSSSLLSIYLFANLRLKFFILFQLLILEWYLFSLQLKNFRLSNLYLKTSNSIIFNFQIPQWFINVPLLLLIYLFTNLRLKSPISFQLSIKHWPRFRIDSSEQNSAKAIRNKPRQVGNVSVKITVHMA